MNFLNFTKQRKRWLIIGGLGLLFIITDPTKSDFNNYMDANGVKAKGGRIGYFLFFSIWRYENNQDRIITYVGIFKNFINITTDNN